MPQPERDLLLKMMKLTETALRESAAASDLLAIVAMSLAGASPKTTALLKHHLAAHFNEHEDEVTEEFNLLARRLLASTEGKDMALWSQTTASRTSRSEAEGLLKRLLDRGEPKAPDKSES
jgi:siroheme synthase (precorrin-2 oxidase/ferrochelatase)